MMEREDESPLRAFLDMVALTIDGEINGLKAFLFGFFHDVRIESVEPIVENGDARYALATLRIDERSYYPLRIHSVLDILEMHTREFVHGEAGCQACADFRIDADVLEGALVPALLVASRELRS